MIIGMIDGKTHFLLELHVHTGTGCFAYQWHSCRCHVKHQCQADKVKNKKKNGDEDCMPNHKVNIKGKGK